MNETDGIGAYGKAWLEPDPQQRLALLERAWAVGAVYCDPLAHVVGREKLSQHVGETQASLSDGRIEVTAEATRHHDSAHFPWAMRDASGEHVMSGFDVVQLDGNGRITRLTGFFDT